MCVRLLPRLPPRHLAEASGPTMWANGADVSRIQRLFEMVWHHVSALRGKFRATWKIQSIYGKYEISDCVHYAEDPTELEQTGTPRARSLPVRLSARSADNKINFHYCNVSKPSCYRCVNMYYGLCQSAHETSV